MFCPGVNVQDPPCTVQLAPAFAQAAAGPASSLKESTRKQTSTEIQLFIWPTGWPSWPFDAFCVFNLPVCVLKEVVLRRPECCLQCWPHGHITANLQNERNHMANPQLCRLYRKCPPLSFVAEPTASRFIWCLMHSNTCWSTKRVGVRKLLLGQVYLQSWLVYQVLLSIIHRNWHSEG